MTKKLTNILKPTNPHLQAKPEDFGCKFLELGELLPLLPWLRARLIAYWKLNPIRLFEYMFEWWKSLSKMNTSVVSWDSSWRLAMWEIMIFNMRWFFIISIRITHVAVWITCFWCWCWTQKWTNCHRAAYYKTVSTKECAYYTAQTKEKKTLHF